MPDDVNLRRRVPDDLMGVVEFLRQANRVHLSAYPTDLAAFLPTVRVVVREVNRGVARVARMKRVVISDAELVLPDVEPQDRGLGRRVTGDERLLIPVVRVVRARREAEVRRRGLVPEPARGLVALVLRLDDGRLVPVVVRVSAEI